MGSRGSLRMTAGITSGFALAEGILESADHVNLAAISQNILMVDWWRRQFRPGRPRIAGHVVDLRDVIGVFAVDAPAAHHVDAATKFGRAGFDLRLWSGRGRSSVAAGSGWKPPRADDQSRYNDREQFSPHVTPRRVGCLRGRDQVLVRIPEGSSEPPRLSTACISRCSIMSAVWW